MATTRDPNGNVTFVYRPDPGAQHVFLAGSFNDWDPAARRLEKTRDGSFRTSLNLPDGRHCYKFVVDGQWVADPEAAEQQPNGLGTTDSVVCVAAPQAPAAASNRTLPVRDARRGRAPSAGGRIAGVGAPRGK